jgi:uncharacterized membrane protein YhaH (DUF805 family)
MKWFFKCWDQYADFSSRARRKEFWMFYLFNMLIFILFYLLIALAFAFGDETLLMLVIALFVIYLLAAFIPYLAVTVRRLHDTGKSGWTILISLIPLIGGFLLLIFLLTDSYPMSNQWGPNPKERNGANSYEDRSRDPAFRQDRETRHFQQQQQRTTERYTRISINIGRDSSCDIRVDDRFEDVSRHHATITEESGALIFEDRSSNGSSVNGQRLHHSRKVIQNGDRIILGANCILSWNDINRFF